MDLYERALRKIKADQRCKKNMVIVGPTGPTGATGPSGGPTGPTGATAQLFKSSNKNNHRLS